MSKNNGTIGTNSKGNERLVEMTPAERIEWLNSFIIDETGKQDPSGEQYKHRVVETYYDTSIFEAIDNFSEEQLVQFLQGGPGHLPTVLARLAKRTSSDAFDYVIERVPDNKLQELLKVKLDPNLTRTKGSYPMTLMAWLANRQPAAVFTSVIARMPKGDLMTWLNTDILDNMGAQVPSGEQYKHQIVEEFSDAALLAVIENLSDHELVQFLQGGPGHLPTVLARLATRESTAAFNSVINRINNASDVLQENLKLWLDSSCIKADGTTARRGEKNKHNIAEKISDEALLPVLDSMPNDELRSFLQSDIAGSPSVLARLAKRESPAAFANVIARLDVTDIKLLQGSLSDRTFLPDEKFLGTIWTAAAELAIHKKLDIILAERPMSSGLFGWGNSKAALIEMMGGMKSKALENSSRCPPDQFKIFEDKFAQTSKVLDHKLEKLAQKQSAVTRADYKSTALPTGHLAGKPQA